MSDGNEHSIEELKKIRSSAKANVTRKINRLNEFMSSNENIHAVEQLVIELNLVLDEFQLAHNEYQRKLVNDEENASSSNYCEAVLEEATKHKARVNQWLSEQRRADQESEIRPDDSVSNISSQRSRKSKASSVRSSASAKATAAAKKAALEARAASLQVLD